MATEKYTQTYAGPGLGNAATGIFKLPTIDGTISSIRIDASTVSDGDSLFQATIDGVEIVGSGDLFIADTDDFVEVSGLSIATTEGGWFYVNLLSPLPAGLPDPPYGLTIFWDNGVPVVASEIHAATGKTTPVDADELGIVDSAASNVLKKLTWANLKATLKTYFDTQYPAETTSTLGATINGASAATPNDTDLVTTVDTSVVKKITWTNVKAFLKTYFDTLYQATGAVDDTAYDATSWNGDTTHAPSKNAIRDKIESLGSASISDAAYDASWDSDTTTAPSKNAVYDKIQTLGGGGTVTHTGGALTANAVVLGAGSDDAKVVTGIVTDGTSVLTLGVAGSSVGAVAFKNATSGTVTLQPVTGALGTVTLSLPAATDTLVGKATTDTLTNKTLTAPTLTAPVLGTPASGNLSNCTADGTDAVGFRNIPQNSQSVDYTCVLADSGKHIYETGATKTITIPANGSVAYPIGTALTFIATNATGCSIAITSDTMTLAGSTTTGTRTLAQNGVATAIKVTSTSWIISGMGLT